MSEEAWYFCIRAYIQTKIICSVNGYTCALSCHQVKRGLIYSGGGGLALCGSAAPLNINPRNLRYRMYIVRAQCKCK